MNRSRCNLFFVNSSGNIIKTNLRSFKSETIRARKLTRIHDDEVREICRYNSRIYCLMKSNFVSIINIEQSKLIVRRSLRDFADLARSKIAANRNMVVIAGKKTERPVDVETIFILEMLTPQLATVASLELKVLKVATKEQACLQNLLIHSACPLDPNQPSLAVVSLGTSIRLYCLHIVKKSISHLQTLDIAARSIRIRGNNLYIATIYKSVKRIMLNLS